MAIPSDTHPAADAVQLRLLSESTPGRRAGIMRSLSTTVVELSRRALRERMPGATETEVLIRWVELSYGRPLAERVRQRLAHGA